MVLQKENIEKLIAKYEKQASNNFNNYQETGSTRYETAYRNAEDIADTLRVALDAADDHASLIHMRGQLSVLAGEASHAETLEAKEKVLKSLIAFARMQHLIGADAKLPETIGTGV